MRRPAEEPDRTEPQANAVDSTNGEPDVPATVDSPRADHPLLGLGLAIETYHRGVT